jgi:dTDP-4-amino-4,6-dideoxygalactose transaminase
MWSYKDHGKSWEGVYERQHPPGPRLVHDSFGTNGRMLEMQAAIGLIQLERMAGWTESRARIAAAITGALSRHRAVRVPRVPNDVVHGWYRVYGFIEPEALAAGWTRDRIIQEISDAGVPCFHGSAPEVYLERAFDGTGWRPAERLPMARRLGETSISFLCHPTLTGDEVERICFKIDDVMQRADSNPGASVGRRQ